MNHRRHYIRSFPSERVELELEKIILLHVSTCQLGSKQHKITIKMSFPYKHVLLIGATAGIGRAMADRFIETGVKVTAVGRRQERLDEFVRKHGEDKASGVAFDISDISKTRAFAERLVQASISLFICSITYWDMQRDEISSWH